MSTCRHVWQPYANNVRIWQVCTLCGVEEHVTTHKEQLRQTVAYIFSDVGEKRA